jgi:hypothetical protein
VQQVVMPAVAGAGQGALARALPTGRMDLPDMDLPD